MSESLFTFILVTGILEIMSAILVCVFYLSSFLVLFSFPFFGCIYLGFFIHVIELYLFES